MLRHVMGEEPFQRGLREYMRIPPGQPAGLEEFAAALSRAAGRDVEAFLQPWVEGTTIPAITARIDDDFLIVAQSGPIFRLPLEIELITPTGPVRRTIPLDQREDTLRIEDVGVVTDALLDPDHHFLLLRRRGEVVRFELHAPEAKEVALAGDFTDSPIPATHEDGVWSVVVPLTAGRYAWNWIADDRQVEAGIRVVRPEQDLQSSYPR